MAEAKIQKIHKGYKTRDYLKKYTLCFAVLAVIVFSFFWLHGKTLIFESDGWNQHFKAMVYYARYVRSIIRRLVSDGSLVIPNWDFAIGEGSDILSTFHYYGMGDPFYLAAFLVPTRFLYLYYGIAVIARFYFAGVFFLMLCLFMQNTRRDSMSVSQNAILAGTLVYVFCTWNLVNACKHVYFINAMVFLPLLILGAEKVLEHYSPSTFIIAVAISAASNFYFFYMLVLLTVIYVIVRCIVYYKKDVVSWLKDIGILLLWSVAGCALAAVSLLPILMTFLGDARMGTEHAHHLLYPLSYYYSLPALFLSSGHRTWLCMGFAVPTILALVILFGKNGHKLLKILLLTGFVMVLFPVFGQVMNGFSYITNRWSFALALPMAYAVVITWDELLGVRIREALLSLVIIIGFLAACLFLKESAEPRAYSSLFICLLFLIVSVLPMQEKGLGRRVKETICLTLVGISIISNAYWLYAPAGEGAETTQRVLDAKVINKKLTENEYRIIKKQGLKEGLKDYTYRFSGRNLTKNANVLEQVSSTQFYWSITNPYSDDFRRQMEVKEAIQQSYEGYNDRAELMALSGVRYYVTKKKDKRFIPYGYRKIGTHSIYNIYENEYCLPLVYAYSGYVLRDEWDKLNAVDKQSMMLSSAVLERDVDLIDSEKAISKNDGVEYKLLCDQYVTQKDQKFTVSKAGGTITLEFNGLKNCETYCRITGLDFTASLKYPKRDDGKANIRIKSSEGRVEVIKLLNKEFKHYGGRHDFCVNLGYSKNSVKSITIRFAEAGIYSYNDIGIYCNSLNGFPDQIEALKENADTDIAVATDTIKVHCKNEEPVMLCVAVPYSKGWSVSVDGRETEVYHVNVRNMGILLDKGNHEITMHYKSPYLHTGAFISLIAFIAITLYAIITHIYKTCRKRNGEHR